MCRESAVLTRKPELMPDSLRPGEGRGSLTQPRPSVSSQDPAQCPHPCPCPLTSNFPARPVAAATFPGLGSALSPWTALPLLELFQKPRAACGPRRGAGSTQPGARAGLFGVCPSPRHPQQLQATDPPSTTP